MKREIFLYLSIIHFSLVLCQNKTVICDDNNGDIVVEEALRIPKLDSIWLYSSKNTYSVKGLKWDGRKFSMDEVNVIGDKKDNDNGIKFMVDYPNKGHRMVKIAQGQENGIAQLIGMLYDIDANGKELSAEQISLNMYTYAPKKEPLNLQSLLAKFPQNNIQNLMTAITNFPLNGAPDLPPRLFIYYIEKPSKNSKKGCPDCYKSKRHLFVAENKTYGSKPDEIEPDWHSDLTTDAKCDDLNGVIVNASVAINDYTSNANERHFDLVEFVQHEYRLYRVTISDKKVLPIKLVKKGQMRHMFGCEPEPTPETPEISTTDEQPSTSLPGGVTTRGSDTSKPTKPGDTGKLWSILLILIILIVLIATLAIAYICWTKSRQNRYPLSGESRPMEMEERGPEVTKVTPLAPSPGMRESEISSEASTPKQWTESPVYEPPQGQQPAPSPGMEPAEPPADSDLRTPSSRSTESLTYSDSSSVPYKSLPSSSEGPSTSPSPTPTPGTTPPQSQSQLNGPSAQASQGSGADVQPQPTTQQPAPTGSSGAEEPDEMTRL